MGGSGSGNRYHYSTKPTEQNFWRFSAASLKKFCMGGGGRKWGSGSLQWSSRGEVRSSISYEINTLESPAWLRVHYTNKGSGEKYDYKIRLTTTRPHYGGERWWFICPAQGCGRRVGVLFLSHIFACRHCCNLAYSSQNEDYASRLLSKAQKIHQQLGGDGVVDGAPPKPKGMHWKTYWRKVEIMEEANETSLLMAVRKFGMFL